MINIVTHNGTFHSDEVIAVAMISLLDKISIVRTRNKEELSKAMGNMGTYVLDVGGEFRPASRNFDHHMRDGGPGVRTYGKEVPYATAGMLWKDIGVDVINMIGFYTPEEDIKIWKIMDEKFICQIDGEDNGLEYTSPISEIISCVNMTWDADGEVENGMVEFRSAVKIAKIWLEAKIKSIVADLNLDQVMRETKEKWSISKTKEILVLPRRFPWEESLLKDDDLKGVLYVITPEGEEWRVTAVPKELNKFGDRKSLPERLRGMSQKELVTLTGIPYMVFVHRNGFTSGTTTYKSAIELANLAIAE